MFQKGIYGLCYCTGCYKSYSCSIAVCEICRGRPKFGFGFGFGAESWQMTSFGIVSKAGSYLSVFFRFRPKLTLTFGHQPKVYFNLRNATLVLLLVGLAYSACQAVSLRKAILGTKMQIPTCARVYIYSNVCEYT